MRICLVRPPSFLNAEVFPQSLGTIAAVLEQASHDVILVDGEIIAQRIISEKNHISKIASLRNRFFPVLKVKSEEVIINKFFLNDETLWDEISREIILSRPDIVGISCYSASMSSVKEITYRLRNKYGLVTPVILGGIHPTSTPFETMTELPWIDYVVIGEGEETLLELISAIKHSKHMENVKGIGFRKNGDILITNPRPAINLDAMPLTKFDLGNFDYIDYVLVTSRGCPFNCEFCASKVMWGKKVRFRPAASVVKEVMWLREERNVKTIRFGDDTFTLNFNHIKNISDLLKKESINDVIYSVGSRIDTIDDKKLAILKEMGVYHISFGIESGSNRIINQINKDIKLNDVVPIIRMVNDAGIYTSTFFIINHPAETKEDMADTMKLIDQLHNNCTLNTTELNTGFPYPGTNWWDYCREHGLLTNINIYNYSHKYNHQQAPQVNMSSEDIDTLNSFRVKIYQKAFFYNFIRRLKKMLTFVTTDPKRLIRRIFF